MTIHEFGTENERVIVLIHPSVVMWDYFEYVIPLLEKEAHLIVPALPGYDPDVKADFTSIEQIADELEGWLSAHGITDISCIYGCSMGGSVVLRFLAKTRLRVHTAVLDGGITPYQLPRILTRFIAVRDFLMISTGKLGGVKMLEKAFSTDEYSEEDLQYIAKILKMMSARTIWRTFDSCNNYSMPEPVSVGCGKIEYWYADAEKKARRWDIAYMKNNLPQTVFKEFEDIGHGGLAVLQPERLASDLKMLMFSDEVSRDMR